MNIGKATVTVSLRADIWTALGGGRKSLRSAGLWTNSNHLQLICTDNAQHSAQVSYT